MIRLLILFFWLLLAGQTAASEQPQSVELKYGASCAVSNGFNICFVALVGDSRCPADGQCIWPGNARIEIELGSGSGKKAVYLNTFLHPRAARYQNCFITFEALKPHLFSGQTAKEKDYTAVLSVLCANADSP